MHHLASEYALSDTIAPRHAVLVIGAVQFLAVAPVRRLVRQCHATDIAARNRAVSPLNLSPVLP